MMIFVPFPSLMVNRLPFEQIKLFKLYKKGRGKINQQLNLLGLLKKITYSYEKVKGLISYHNKNNKLNKMKSKHNEVLSFKQGEKSESTEGSEIDSSSHSQEQDEDQS